jgi:Fe-S-cluster-containing hydrogenase component 2
MSGKGRIEVNPAKCRASGECVKICPRDAIAIKDGKAVIDQAKCDQDGLCIPACPNDAIEVRDEA